jgi:hypothetical protein
MKTVAILMFLGVLPSGMAAFFFGVDGTGSGGSSVMDLLGPAFGAAAPFAALALVQMTRAQNKVDRLEADHRSELATRDKEHKEDIARKDEQLERIRADNLTRERELVLRFGNIIYDSALLYKEGSVAVDRLARSVATPTPSTPASLDQVLLAIRELSETMTRGHVDEHDDRPGT